MLRTPPGANIAHRNSIAKHWRPAGYGARMAILYISLITGAALTAVGVRLRRGALSRSGFETFYRKELQKTAPPFAFDIPNGEDLKVNPLARIERFALYKRLIDITASIALLVVFSPLILLIAFAIRAESAGPILYRQRRVGHMGKEFDVIKFRSMVNDAEKDGPQYACLNDARVTRVGRIIRKMRLDEIPQAINVLRGEMSFVGPRPERPEFVKLLENAIPNYHRRHAIKPGITGWAQVKYEYAATVEGAREKLRYDLYYLDNFTPLMDLAIILATVRVVIFGVGSR